MIILPTWVLVVGTSIVFLLATVLGILLCGVRISTEACKRLNNSELKVFTSLMTKVGGLDDIRWAKKES